MRKQEIIWYTAQEKMPQTHKDLIFFVKSKEEYRLGEFVKLADNDVYFVEHAYPCNEYPYDCIKEWAYID